ncbi:MAG: peptidase [candidate division Zixibacteria bacterium]|nr:peptidase [candidate division Zixibacteria bacterium]
MRNESSNYPIIDLHCDMLHYLATVPNSSPDNSRDIGCSIGRLEEGKVRLQVMAISSVEKEPDVMLTHSQIVWFRRFIEEYGDNFNPVTNIIEAREILKSDKTGIMASIENAGALCNNDESLDSAFDRLEQIIETTGKLLYISLTHHGESRFGGGNQTGLGLKDDGRSFLDYINNRKIAVDLSHTSDALAHDIIDYIDKRGLKIPLIASHSNYRRVFNHPRNLPDELAKEIIDRDGLIGVNFLRAFMHPDDPDYLARHILYGLRLGGEKAICFGADYFCTNSHPDKSREPFYFEAHRHAGQYQEILFSLKDELDDEILKALANDNVIRYLNRYW